LNEREEPVSVTEQDRTQVGEEAASGGPLAGVRVLELAAIGPAPFAAMMLADLGAEVIRLDRPGTGAPGVPHPRFEIQNRGRSSVAIDLKHPDAAAVVLQLLGDADVLLEGLRPGVVERLGLGPQRCLAHNPRLVYGRMTGWGRDGELAATAGHDINYLARSGVLHNLRGSDGRPTPPANLLGDFGGGGMLLLSGVLAALLAARSTGVGQVVDAAIVDGAATLLTMPLGLMAAGVWDADRPGGNLLDGGAPFYQVYETADDRFVAVGAIEPQFYAELLRGLGLDPAELPPQLKRRHWPETTARFRAVFRTRTRDEWDQIFAATDACVTPVLTPAEAAADRKLARRALYFHDSDGIMRPAPAPRFSVTALRSAQGQHPPGADTERALARAGFSSGEIVDLLRRGVIASGPAEWPDSPPRSAGVPISLTN
jgi:alpha-methylacyl-CoA racemase